MIPDSISYGYCHCGCGRQTNISRGKPRRFLAGHQQRVHATDAERLLAKVPNRPEGACWEWTGPCTRNGYGELDVGSRIDGSYRKVYAHRLSYEVHVGPIPEGMYVCHTCDNRACVNPAHLFIGTQDDNMADAARKGRCPGVSLQGERHPRARLTEGQVLAIRARRAAGESERDVAREYGVSPQLVYAIHTRRLWKHLPLAE